MYWDTWTNWPEEWQPRLFELVNDLSISRDRSVAELMECVAAEACLKGITLPLTFDEPVAIR
jgi:hypothetical protein